jgi:hypothetical protein
MFRALCQPDKSNRRRWQYAGIRPLVWPNCERGLVLEEEGPDAMCVHYALTRTVLGQALQFFRLSALQNCEFQGCFPKN